MAHYSIHQRIRETNKKAIKHVRDVGIHTAIVTGRGRAGAITAMDILGLEMPVICSAGSLIFTNHGSDTISARTFQLQDELSRIVNFTRKYNMGLIADSLDGNWWYGPDELSEDLDPLTAAYAGQSRRTFSARFTARLLRYYEPLGLPPGSARLQPSGLIRPVFPRLGCQVGSLLFHIALSQRATA